MSSEYPLSLAPYTASKRLRDAVEVVLGRNSVSVAGLAGAMNQSDVVSKRDLNWMLGMAIVEPPQGAVYVVKMTEAQWNRRLKANLDLEAVDDGSIKSAPLQGADADVGAVVEPTEVRRKPAAPRKGPSRCGMPTPKSDPIQKAAVAASDELMDSVDLMPLASGTPRVIKVSDLVEDPTVQPRVKCDEKTIEKYCATMKDGIRLDPVKVYASEDESGKFVIVDGAHRKAAAILAGLKELDALVYKLTPADAFLAAVQANKNDRLNFTDADRRHAVRQMLANEGTKDWTDARIAATVGVAGRTVGRYRQELIKELKSTDAEADTVSVSPMRESIRRGKKVLVNTNRGGARPRSAETKCDQTAAAAAGEPDHNPEAPLAAPSVTAMEAQGPAISSGGPADGSPKATGRCDVQDQPATMNPAACNLATAVNRILQDVDQLNEQVAAGTHVIDALGAAAMEHLVDAVTALAEKFNMHKALAPLGQVMAVTPAMIPC